MICQRRKSWFLDLHLTAPGLGAWSLIPRSPGEPVCYLLEVHSWKMFQLQLFYCSSAADRSLLAWHMELYEVSLQKMFYAVDLPKRRRCQQGTGFRMGGLCFQELIKIISGSLRSVARSYPSWQQPHIPLVCSGTFKSYSEVYYLPF